MGVPALFRWLSQKYPKIISSVVEEHPLEIDGAKVPVDTTRPNPNGEEMDNLYLDMNGIVHPCSHPEDRPPPATEGEMMLEVFKYTDRVVNMVRPRKLLMIAVDGVAPRAKMNQQRSRRFRSAQEAKEKDEEKQEFLKLLKQQNNGVLPESAQENLNKKTWDSNAITPGTPFMFILAASLRYWCAYKLNTDPAWAKLKVIISDATVPGEGEHKIMEFIRSQRSSPEHDPNTRHVIYGLDADLIMLGLATHEPHFRVLREDVFFNDGKPRTCRICGQTGHLAAECKGEVKVKQGEFDEKAKVPTQKPFIWLHVSILREYLAVEMNVPSQPFKFDLERALDDWVFMCFFVGNDFLPHLPSLDIREQGIDTLITIWRDSLSTMGGYVTKDGQVDLQRAQHILAGLAKQEDAIFKRRKQAEDRQNANAKRRRIENEEREERNNRRQSGNKKYKQDSAAPDAADLNLTSLSDLSQMPSWGNITKQETPGKPANGITHDMIVNRSNASDANKSAAAILKERLMAKKTNGSVANDANGEEAQTSPTADKEATSTPPSALGKRKADAVDEEPSTPGRDSPIPAVPAKKADADEPPPDTVRLWEDGYADRYYEQKFHVDPSNLEFRHQVGRDYVEGLAWVLLYYFQGCPSWTWYYPHHYAPFAADFVDLEKMELSFDKGKPFKPFEQLMGVLPAASNHAIPKAFHSLMTDDDSDIKDFYPEDFHVDLNGKKFAWQGVAILPFIDEKRLLRAMNEKYDLLSDDEKRRNELGRDVLIFSEQHPMYESVVDGFYSKKQGAPKVNLVPKISEGLAGKIEKDDDFLPASDMSFPGEKDTMPDLEPNNSMSVFYDFPKIGHVHKSMLLRGVKFPTPALDQSDIDATRNKAMNPGRSYGGASFRGDHRNGGGRGGRGGRNGGGRGGYDGSPNNGRPNPFGPLVNPEFQMPPGGGRPGYPAYPRPPPGMGWNGYPPQQPNMPMNGMPPDPRMMRGAPPPPPPPNYGQGGYGNGNYGYGGYGNGGYGYGR